MVQIFVKVLSLDNWMELFLYTDNKKEDVRLCILFLVYIRFMYNSP